jgi:dolichyl-phosphate beta-glucosyltransferase
MRLSLVIPTYDCRDLALGTVDSALRHLASRHSDSELIVVDDGSKDGTADAIEALVPGSSRLRVLRSEQNCGKGAAVRKGVLAANAENVVFTDVDLAYPLPEIDKVLGALDDGADVAIATRVDRESRVLMSPTFFRYLYTRHLGSRMFNGWVRFSLGLGVSDSQAGLKGFRRDAAQAIFSRLTRDGFAFDVEVLVIARRLGLSVREIPVLYRYDSEPTTVAFLRDAAGALVDTWRIRRNDRLRRYG